MRNSNRAKAVRNLAVIAVISGPLTAVMATNGYFPHGYGMKAKGMGGASVAMTDNAFAGAINPATAVWAGNRIEAGVDLFMPDRDTSNTGGAAAKSDGDVFLIPEFGYNRTLSDKLGVGVTVYGNGGMNTDYPLNFFGGTPPLGINLMQLIIAPTVAYKINDSHSVGVSPLLVHQRFKAEGLTPFAGYSSNSGALTNNGYDSSNGIGVRLGYLGKLNDQVSIGAAYSPKISMSRFAKYAGLFAGGGDFDIPANYTLGATLQATPSVLFALDYQRINYSGVASVSNPSGNLLLGRPLGAADGPGFGWSDVNVWKLGVQWQATPKLTLRAGVNVGDNPIKNADVTFNILAPGVITKHYTLGGTYTLSNTSEVSFSYMHAPSNAVSGNNLLGSGVDTVRMSQKALGVQFGWKF
jgi:long-chain fatty acid transport protein